MMDASTLARLRYPFPTLVNPHAQAMQEYTEARWIDGEWKDFVTPKIASGFKKVRTAYMTAYFFPMASWDRLIPLARMMLFSLYHDDLYEKATPEQVRHLRKQTVAVARGEMTPQQAGVMLGKQIAIIRQEILQFVPEEAAQRWAFDLDLYFEGLEAETSYVTADTYPSIDNYTAMREKCLMLHPFMALKEVETGVVLPSEIHEHPAVQELKSLAVRITGWFNEFQSYDKDTKTGMGNVNLINVIAHEEDIGTDAAREKVFDLHKKDLDRFTVLQHNLPDFGEWHDRVANHISHISFVISGWRGVDAHIQRYDPEYYLDQHDLVANAQESTGTINHNLRTARKEHDVQTH